MVYIKLKMKTNFIIMALVATTTNAIQLKYFPIDNSAIQLRFSPIETKEDSVYSETMKSLKESE